MRLLKSPLRYPGGKTRAVKFLASVLPLFREYREPLVGGGSMFIYIRQVYPDIPVWINDLNYDLFCFWQQTQKDSRRLAAEIASLGDKYTTKRRMFDELKHMEGGSDLQRAARFFTLNRITFSGLVGSGGFSDGTNRFTDSAIKRVAAMGRIMEGVKVTHGDYAAVLEEDGRDVFLYLDPPYMGNEKSKLYGRNGELHTGFDHERLALLMRACRHTWLISYNDSQVIRSMYPLAHAHPWNLQYGMNNYRQEAAPMGKELLLANYPLPVGAQGEFRI